MKIKEKKGISLIVLVITIIIMIILAAAIILSLTNNGIIGNAKDAVAESNEAERTIEENIVLAESEEILIKNRNPWDGSISDGFAAGDGSKNNPYIIKNGSQLAYLAKTVNDGNNYEDKYIKITEFINLGNKPWVPIGLGGVHTGDLDFTSLKSFNGTIDGQGNVIGNINVGYENYYGVGLFGSLGSKGKIQNVRLIMGNVVGSVHSGGIVGINYGTISNCLNTVNVISKDKSSVSGSGEAAGGIAGTCESGGVIRYCTNRGDITTLNSFGIVARGKRAGGITAYADAIDKDTIIDNCINYGTVTVGYQVVGGITASIYAENDEVKVTVSNCKNYGNVTAKTNQALIASGKSAGSFAGGIVGWMQQGNLEVTNCTNSGEIIAEGCIVGGIVGDITNGNINNSSNLGYILSKCIGLRGISGGIVARVNNGNIKNVYNSGTVETLKHENLIDVAGGVVGMFSQGNISGAYSNGLTKGNGNTIEIETNSGIALGGIIGQNITGGNIRNSYYKQDSSPRGIGSDSSDTAVYTPGVDTNGKVYFLNDNINSLKSWISWMNKNL